MCKRRKRAAGRLFPRFGYIRVQQMHANGCYGLVLRLLAMKSLSTSATLLNTSRSSCSMFMMSSLSSWVRRGSAISLVLSAPIGPVTCITHKLAGNIQRGAIEPHLYQGYVSVSHYAIGHRARFGTLKRKGIPPGRNRRQAQPWSTFPLSSVVCSLAML